MLLLGVAMMTLAQFMEAVQPVYRSIWIGRASRGYIPNAGTRVDTLVKAGVSGWGAHPIAPVILAILAALFIFNIDFGPGWMRFRFWIAGALLAVCLIPVNVEGAFGNGVVVGWFAVVLTVIAALLRRKEA